MTTITKETEYVWYKAALAGKNPPIHEGDVQSGRFRMRQKDGPAVAVAIWREWKPVTGPDGVFMGHDGLLMASYDLKTYNCDETAEPQQMPDGSKRPTNYHRLADKWTFLSKAPIAPGLYKAFYESGCTKWPDESQAGAELRAAAQAEKTNQPAPVTFQHPPNTFEGIIERYNKYKPQADALIAKGGATDGITADIAADLKNVFGGLETTADTLRLTETLPFRDEVKNIRATIKPLQDQVDKLNIQVDEINAKWYVPRDGAKATKKQLSEVVITPHHAAEIVRLQAEQAARNAQARENNVPQTKEMTDPPKVSSGTMGRRVTPRKVASAKITDERAFLAFLAGNDKIHTRILETMQQIADTGASTDPAKCASYPGVVYEHSTVSV